METTLTYNIKVTRDVKISYMKYTINNKELNNIKNTKKYIPCPKFLVLNSFLV